MTPPEPMRAERLLAAWAGRGFTIDYLEDRPPVATNTADGVLYRKPYAQVRRGHAVVATINHEWIDECFVSM